MQGDLTTAIGEKMNYKPGDTIYDKEGREYAFVRQTADAIVVRDAKTGGTSMRTLDGKVKTDPGSGRELVLGSSRPIRNFTDNKSGSKSNTSSTTRSFEHEGRIINLTVSISIS